MQKIVWSEGMSLTPQHLQQLDQQIHNQLWYFQQQQSCFPYGLVDLEWDKEAQKNGVLKINKLDLTFQNGTLYSLAAQIKNPLIVASEQLTRGTYTLYAALPANEHVSNMPGYTSLPMSRYHSQAKWVADQIDPQKQIEMLFASPNLELHTDNEMSTAYLNLPIAQIKCDALGKLSLCDYIPPCLNLKPAQNLIRKLADLRLILNAKIQQFEYSQAEVKNNTSLLLVKQIAGQLDSFITYKMFHPFTVFDTLSIFINTVGKSPTKTRYQHEQCDQSFVMLFATIDQWLETFQPDEQNQIELAEIKPGYWQTPLLPDDEIQHGNTYFIFTPTKNNVTWQKNIANHIKVGTPKTIDHIVNAGLSGLELIKKTDFRFAPNLSTEACVFQISKNSPLWDAVLNEKQFCLFIAEPSRNCTMEVIHLC